MIEKLGLQITNVELRNVLNLKHCWFLIFFKIWTLFLPEAFLLWDKKLNVKTKKCRVHENRGCISYQDSQLIITIDKPTNFYLNKHVFENNARFTLRHVFWMSVAYKSIKMTSMLIFSATLLTKCYIFWYATCYIIWYKLFNSKDIFQITCLNFEVRITLVYGSKWL